ncbi:MAG: thioesterase domain-containing protein [Salaquimonas sp.]|nr:thioesterase domain-containing protein [Salaquimonas sp.]
MKTQELETYLHEQIPLSLAMGVSVVSISDENVVLTAPLVPNINHRETLFGGSASAIAILAAWSLVHTRLAAAGMTRAIVIRRNTMKYELPVDDSFATRSFLEQPDRWQGFVEKLAERGMAKIQVGADLECHGRRTGHLTGEFVAFDTATLKRVNNLTPKLR